jgi:hypothetical protein
MHDCRRTTRLRKKKTVCAAAATLHWLAVFSVFVVPAPSTLTTVALALVARGLLQSGWFCWVAAENAD